MPDVQKETSHLQLERAHLLLKSVPLLIEAQDYFSAVNRSYYAAFHAIKAIELLDNFDSKKHSGLLAHFRMNYIKTGIFDPVYSELLKNLSQYRQDSDYDIFVQISKEEAEEQYDHAKLFVSAVEKYISTR